MRAVLGEAEQELRMLHSCKSDDAQAAREMADSHRRLKVGSSRQPALRNLLSQMVVGTAPII